MYTVLAERLASRYTTLQNYAVSDRYSLKQTCLAAYSGGTRSAGPCPLHHRRPRYEVSGPSCGYIACYSV